MNHIREARAAKKRRRQRRNRPGIRNCRPFIRLPFLGINRGSGNEFWTAPMPPSSLDLEATLKKAVDEVSKRGPQPLILHPNNLTGPVGDLLRRLGYIP